MTTIIRPAHTLTTHTASSGAVVPSAEIWDIDRKRSAARGTTSVRPLAGSTRTSHLSPGSMESEYIPSGKQFETGRAGRARGEAREGRDNLLLGGLLTAALLIGSAVGGVFGPADVTAERTGADVVQSGVPAAEWSAAAAK